MSLLPSKPDTSAVDDAEPRVIGVDSDDADDVISALSSETARKLLAELHEEPAPPSALSERVDTSLQNAQYHLQKLEAAGAVSVVDTAYSEKGREMDVYAPADQPLVIFAGDEERTTGLKAAISRLLGGVGVLALGSLAIQTLYGSNESVADDRPAAGAGGGNGGGAAGANATGAETATPTEKVGTSGEATPEATGTVEPTGGTETVQIFDATDAPEAVSTAETTTTTAEAIDGAANATTEAARTTTEAAQPAAEAAVNAGLPPGLLFFAGGTLVLALWLVVWYRNG